ncbi:hypothetical protein J5991_04220 [Methanocorpusculum sp.]|nr:hypothetical protein [Methanocorpusculum sp.]
MKSEKLKECAFVEKTRKAYVNLMVANGYLGQAEAVAEDYQDQDSLLDAAKLVDVAANIILQVLERNDKLEEVECST